MLSSYRRILERLKCHGVPCGCSTAVLIVIQLWTALVYYFFVIRR